MMLPATIIICAALAFAHAGHQTPARDARTPTAGTASIAGVVVTDDTERRPVRRARVSVSSADRLVGRTAITTDAGAFVLTGLPAGRYTLGAIKAGYVQIFYGARRPNRPGTAIALADGERVTGLVLRLPRGAVLAGTLLDHNGDPASGVSMSALGWGVGGAGGERRLTPAGTSQPTDDRGAYRIYGLAAGEYRISASMRGVSPANRDEMRMMTSADVATALNQLAAGRGAGPVAAPGSTPAPTVGYAAVFYPGTTTASEAGAVTVAQGEERTGLDFQLQLSPTATVEGTLRMPEGTPVASAAVNMINTSPTTITGVGLDVRTKRVDAEGRFAFSGVAPGQYAVVSRAGAGRAAPSPRGSSPVEERTPPLWASADVAVDGQNVSGLALTLQPGLTVSGRVVLDGTTLAPPPMTRLRVNLQAVQNAGEINLGAAAAPVDAVGRFTIEGVTPGRYRLAMTVPGARPDAPGWVVRSATIEGQDTLDVPFDVRRSVDGAVVTLTDATTELSGTVQTSTGVPAPEYYIIVFAADRQFWTPQSRRVQSVRPTAAGSYVVRNLPPGDYLIAAVADVEAGEWFDPAFLQQMVPGATSLRLTAGAKAVSDIQVREARE